MTDYIPLRETLPASIVKRVSLIVHNPTIPARNHQKLNRAMGWGNPYELARSFIQDLYETSYGYIRYVVSEMVEVDAFPPKKDGFCYTAEKFMHCLETGQDFHQPDLVDYVPILQDYNIFDKINRNVIDEVWLFAFPYGGYYESHMAGPGAFWCNSGPLNLLDPGKRRFVIMGFNYERGVGEMLEAYGHRAESIMRYVYRNKNGEQNLYERFIRHDKKNPGQAEVGWMHYAPNSDRDYDWGNKRVVTSRADDWFNYPNLTGENRSMDCRDWGGGDIRAHHKWWFARLPHVIGETDGIANNWWQYIVDPNLAA